MPHSSQELWSGCYCHNKWNQQEKDREFLEKARVVAAVDAVKPAEDLATQKAAAVMCLPPVRVAIAMHARIAILAVNFLEKFRIRIMRSVRYVV
jgi:hypothetical protein